MHQKHFFVLFVLISLIGLDCYAQHRPTIDRSLLEVKPTALKFGCSGGTRRVDVKSGSDWNFSVSDAPWCHVTKSANSLNLSVDENTTSILRKVTIKVSNAGKTVKMISVSQESSTGTQTNASSKSQQGKKGIFSVSPNNKRFNSDGGSQAMTVTGSTNWSIDVNVASWAHLNKNGNNLTLTVDRNSSTSSRSDYFVLKSGEKKFRVDFSQEGQPAIPFSVSPNNKRFDSDGGSQVMTVAGSTNWSIDVNVASWAHLNKNGNNLTLTVDRNSSTSIRSDYFVLKSGEKKVRVDFSQEGQPAISFSVAPNNKRFDSDGGTQVMTVIGSTNWSIDVPVASWAHLNKNGNNLTLTVDRNSSTSIRSDYFVLKSGDKKFRVDFSQDAKSRYLFVGNNNFRVDSKKHFESVSVQSNGDWNVSVAPADWVVLKKNSSSVDLQIKRNRSRMARSDYFELRLDNDVRRINIYQYGREGSWLFKRESGFSSHFLDVHIGADLFSASEKYYVGGSYSFVPSHVGFRISAISEFPYAENLAIDKWILSAGPVLRMTGGASGLDFQAYIGPALWNNTLAWDGGFRLGWHSNNGLSLWDFTLGAILLDEKVVPTVGMGVGIATSPLIGAGAVCFGKLNRHPNAQRPHHFFDCNFSYFNNRMTWSGLAFDWNPSRIGVHSSSWLRGNELALLLGLNWRLFSQDRLFDIQLFGGVGMVTNINSYMADKITYDFGTRINFESHRDFAWYDITIGGLYINGKLIPTVGCGLGLSSLVGGIGALHTILK